MPAILVFIFWIAVLYFVISMAIPTLTSYLATQMIGKAAKLDEEDRFTLSVQYYFITGGLLGAYLALYHAEGLWSGIFNFVMGLLFWPLPVSFMIFGMFDESDDMGILWGCIILGYLITQMLAVIKVLKRAKANSDDPDIM